MKSNNKLLFPTIFLFLGLLLITNTALVTIHPGLCYTPEEDHQPAPAPIPNIPFVLPESINNNQPQQGLAEENSDHSVVEKSLEERILAADAPVQFDVRQNEAKEQERKTNAADLLLYEEINNNNNNNNNNFGKTETEELGFEISSSSSSSASLEEKKESSIESSETHTGFDNSIFDLGDNLEQMEEGEEEGGGRESDLPTGAHSPSSVSSKLSAVMKKPDNLAEYVKIVQENSKKTFENAHSVIEVPFSSSGGGFRERSRVIQTKSLPYVNNCSVGGGSRGADSLDCELKQYVGFCTDAVESDLFDAQTDSQKSQEVKERIQRYIEGRSLIAKHNDDEANGHLRLATSGCDLHQKSLPGQSVMTMDMRDMKMQELDPAVHVRVQFAGTMMDDDGGREEKSDHERRRRSQKNEKSTDSDPSSVAIRVINQDPYDWGMLNAIEYKDSNLPRSVDWHSDGKVSSVKNQYDCGCCYAFATAASVESANAIVNGIVSNYSVQEIVSCSKGFGNDGCNGGNILNSLTYYLRNQVAPTTVALWVDLPYDVQYSLHNEMCPFNLSHVSRFSQIYKVGLIPSNDEASLYAVVSTQPVAVGICGSSFVFQRYESGIITRDDGCGETLNHAVLIVGYGQMKLKNGTLINYWKIKNSFGRGWGMDGYAYIERGGYVCGIGKAPGSFPIVGTGGIQPTEEENKKDVAITYNIGDGSPGAGQGLHHGLRGRGSWGLVGSVGLAIFVSWQLLLFTV
eukprot:Nk52_evm13s322 gene=Nk52_evmTU13s322